MVGGVDPKAEVESPPYGDGKVVLGKRRVKSICGCVSRIRRGVGRRIEEWFLRRGIGG